MRNDEACMHRHGKKFTVVDWRSPKFLTYLQDDRIARTVTSINFNDISTPLLGIEIIIFNICVRVNDRGSGVGSYTNTCTSTSYTV